ncbi:hypothetical protein [Streptomyces sp. MZ04]|uniref:hypothetical protein n=1 Tax=Streptomyces sp. MZ04 TaxID=2559236 RepID=UPI001ADFC1A9|nr:hypothetical protein [Streptomyces sp. MZ04]
MTDAPLPAELLLDREASDDLRHELVSALDGLGVRTARVRRAVDHRGAADIPWIMLASLPLQAFLSGLGVGADGLAPGGVGHGHQLAHVERRPRHTERVASVGRRVGRCPLDPLLGGHLGPGVGEG